MVNGPIFNCKPGKTLGFNPGSLFDIAKALTRYVLLGQFEGMGMAFFRTGLLDEVVGNDAQIHFIPWLRRSEEWLNKALLIHKEECAAFDLDKYGDFGFVKFEVCYCVVCISERKHRSIYLPICG
jgi:hypothetical protein